ncbi:MAG TPA: HAMP domain-containing sensor histidine kinase [Thermoanaerobaculia bacterium]
MSAGQPRIEDSGDVHAREEAALGGRGTWSPRRSLGARLVLYLLPVAVLPALVYWLLVDRQRDRDEQQLLETLLADARRQETRALHEEASDAVRTISDSAGRLVTLVRRVGLEAGRALEAGPDANLPAEEMLDDPGGLLRSAYPGASIAVVSRRTGLTPRALRDLAATRRLEGPFVTLGLGPVDVSAIAVVTASGVVRAVPGHTFRVGGTDIIPSDYGFPSKETRALALLPPPDGPAPFVWTPVYEDLFAKAGKIVTVKTLVRAKDGSVVAEVGVDWVFTRLFEGTPDPTRPEDVEVLVSAEGALLHAAPRDRLAASELAVLTDAIGKNRNGDLEIDLGGRHFLVVARPLSGIPWTYAKVSPRAALEKKVRAQLDPIFEAGRKRRAGLRLLYLAVILALSAGLVAVTSGALAPVRRVARAADALAAGQPMGELPGLDLADEVGRLSRALRNVERRMRWRTASMEGVHRLGQTAALMTQPDETLAQLARQIAQLVGATKGWLVLWDPDTRSLVGAPPGWGIPEGALRGVRAGLEDPTLAVIVYRTGETVLRNDLSDPRISQAMVKRLDVRENVVLAPLRAESGILGVLGVADKPGGFDAEDQAAIEGYADQAALLLRNARLYEELQKSYERLRDAQRNRDYFLQNVNHELRTPLTAILGWSEVLTEDRPDKETVKIAVDQINRSAQFLLALISDLLDLSRYEEGRTRLEPEIVDLGPLVAGAVEPVSVMAEAKGIAMSVETPSAPTFVRLDPLRMRQVLWNLVHNAVKFTPKGGRIRVEASADDAGAAFAVVDNGVGVDAKDLPFIFERFRQVDGSATRAYRGMGIGLALAKAYVELHGGTITVESQPGSGTAFHVRIPRAPSPGDFGAQLQLPT